MPLRLSSATSYQYLNRTTGATLDHDTRHKSYSTTPLRHLEPEPSSFIRRKPAQLHVLQVIAKRQCIEQMTAIPAGPF